MRRSACTAVIGSLLVAAVATGCGGGAGDDSRHTPAGTPDSTEATGHDAKAYVGLTKQAAIARAEASGTPWRITREDDEHFMVTQDYDPTRLNFEIDDGIVTSAALG